jgi:uncharacterized protein
MANSVGYHESEDKLRSETMDNHRALTSMQEELEAADWYDQRVDAATDGDLKEILAHNRDEEKEHAVMALEWLRRRDPELDRFLRQYLFTEGSITEIEEAAEGNEAAGNGAAGDGASLGIGSLRERSNR